MSWSAVRVGTKAAVSSGIAKDLDQCASNYRGKEEEKDVQAAKDRILSAIAEIDVTPDPMATSYGVQVSASGSRSKYSTTVQLSVTRVVLTLD